MRWYLIFMLILLLPVVHANSVVGVVKLTVLNRPPAITTIEILPKEAYSDAILTCALAVNDEQADKVFVSYAWIVNGNESMEKTGKLIGFRAEDNISCEAFPSDVEGLSGESKSAEKVILTPSASLRITKGVLRLFTKNASYEKSAELNADGISGVTGYVVYENGGIPSLLGLIAVLLCISALLLTTLVLRHRMKK
jgi:hypothetical protein